MMPTATTPAARLRRIEAVLADARLTPSEVRAVAAIVYHGNRAGLAWPGQRHLRRVFHVGGETIDSGIEKALGVHFVAAGRGPHGVQQYRVLDVPDEGHAEGASAPAVGAMNQGQRASLRRPARPPGSASAPGCPSSAPGCTPGELAGKPPADTQNQGQCAHSGRAGCAHNRSNQQSEPKEENPTASPPPKRAGNGNGHDGSGDLVGFADQARGQPLTASERAAFLRAVAEAQAAGANDALIRHFIRQYREEPPWIGPNAARDGAWTLSESWNLADLGPARTGLGEVLSDLRYALESALPAPGTADRGTIQARRERIVSWAEDHKGLLDAAGFALPAPGGVCPAVVGTDSG